MSETTLLIFGFQILHKDLPSQDTEDELIYSDIIYPKHIIPGYSFVTVDIPDDLDISMYLWNGTDVELIPAKQT